MDFEWEEEKRLKNIEKHGIDLIDADILFGNPHQERRLTENSVGWQSA